MIGPALAFAAWCAAGQISYEAVPLEHVIESTELVVTMKLDPKALQGARAFGATARAFDAKTRASDSALCVVDADCTRTELVCNVCSPCTNAGGPVARAAANRYRVDCLESLGNPPSPCGPCIVQGAPKAVCRNMTCVDESRTTPPVLPAPAPAPAPAKK